VRADVSPRSALVPAGEAVTLIVTVVNTGDIISAHTVRVLGIDPAWVSGDGQELSLFPGESGTATLSLRFPPGVPAGIRKLTIQVIERTPPEDIQVLEVDLEVPSRLDARIALDPVSVTGGRDAVTGVRLTNRSNAPVELVLHGADPEERLRVELRPTVVRLDPGDQTVATAFLSARRPIVGNPKVRAFTITADGASTPVTTTGTFTQRPLLSRGALGLIGLLAAILVFAAVLAAVLGGVVDTSRDDRDVLLTELAGDEASARGGTAPSAVSGTVADTSGAPVAGITVEAFSAADPGSPIAEAATDADGTYRIERLPAGELLIRARAAGFVERWFPEAARVDDADAVDAPAGDEVDGVDLVIAGAPGLVAGTVEGEVPGGATATLRVPAAEPGEPPVVVDEVTVDSAGAFRIEEVPTPLTGELVVTKAGHATQIIPIALEPGESVEDLVVRLLRGEGSITGTVSGPDGPLGGATVTARAGPAEASTSTLSNGEVGTFALEGLATPASYTLVVELDGFATASRVVELAEGPTHVDVEIELGPLGTGDLVPHTGTLAGRVQRDGEGVAGTEVVIRGAGREFRATTGPDGGFEVRFVPGGEYQVSAAAVDDAETVTVRVGQRVVVILGTSPPPPTTTTTPSTSTTLPSTTTSSTTSSSTTSSSTTSTTVCTTITVPETTTTADPNTTTTFPDPNTTTTVDPNTTTTLDPKTTTTIDPNTTTTIFDPYATTTSTIFDPYATTTSFFPIITIAVLQDPCQAALVATDGPPRGGGNLLSWVTPGWLTMIAGSALLAGLRRRRTTPAV
jgi:hypothetical protein